MEPTANAVRNPISGDSPRASWDCRSSETWCAWEAVDAAFLGRIRVKKIVCEHGYRFVCYGEPERSEDFSQPQLRQKQFSG